MRGGIAYPQGCCCWSHMNTSYHTSAAKLEPLNGATRIVSLHLVRISSNSHRLALSFTHIVRSVYLVVPAATAGFAFSHSLVRWPLNRCTVKAAGLEPAILLNPNQAAYQLAHALKPGIIYAPPVGWKCWPRSLGRPACILLYHNLIAVASHTIFYRVECRNIRSLWGLTCFM